MKCFQKIKDMMHDPDSIISALSKRGLLNWLSDRAFYKLVFRLRMGYKLDLEKPKELPQIIALSEQLAQGTPQARIDTYLVGHKVFFGEITLFHNSGVC